MSRVSVPEALDHYKITDLDSAGSTQYFGYVDKNGNWYIMRLTGTDARYIQGATDYLTNWSNRATLNYDYFNVIF